MKKSVMVSLGLCLLVVVGLLAGCGGDAPAFVEQPTDVVTGHWLLVQQVPVPNGLAARAAAASNVSIIYTGGGLPRWSGSLVDRQGAKFVPDQGEWSKEAGVYTIRNSAGQTLEFIWVGSQLRSTTLGYVDAPATAATATPMPMYQWWTRQ